MPCFVDDEPLRYWSAWQIGCAMHSKPSLVPLQEPALYCTAVQVLELQVVQIPLAVAEDSRRYWLVLHVGWAAHVPLDVADWPVKYCPSTHADLASQVYPSVVPLQLPARYCPVLHLMFWQAVQVPCFVGDEPSRYWPVVQIGCALQRKSLLVPLQEPVLYCTEEVHILKLQVVHVPLAVAEEPCRYWSA